jgi:hypothetical protein
MGPCDGALRGRMAEVVEAARSARVTVAGVNGKDFIIYRRQRQVAQVNAQNTLTSERPYGETCLFILEPLDKSDHSTDLTVCRRILHKLCRYLKLRSSNAMHSLY